MGITDTAFLARKDWTFNEVEALYREVFPETEPCQNRTVLWADTGTNGRDAIVAYLRRRGYFIHLVDNSLDALQYIRECTPDCCLLDIDLLPISGIDLLKSLHQDSFFQQIAVFLLSGSSEGQAVYEKNILKIFSGVNVIKKPITAPVLVAEFNSLWGGAFS